MTFIGNLYNAFQKEKDARTCWLSTLIANYILEGVYFYSGFMFFYNLGQEQEDARLCPGDPIYQPG